MRWLVIVFAFSLLACTDNEKIPKDVIPKVKMQKLLWDMIVADRFNSVFVVPMIDSAKKDSAVFSMYDKVFKLNGTTKDEFLKSYKFYLSRPDITKTMFDSLAAQAERKKSDIFMRHKNLDSSRRKATDTLRGRAIDTFRHRTPDSLRKRLPQPLSHE